LKKTTEKGEKPNLIFTIKILVLGIFVFSVYRIYFQLDGWFNHLNGSREISINEYFQPHLFNYYLPVIILIIPLSGIFINRRIGWRLISAYFYFLLFNGTFMAISKWTDDLIFYVVGIIGILIPLLLIMLMNIGKVQNYYGIEKHRAIVNNTLALTCGIILAVILSWLKNLL